MMKKIIQIDFLKKDLIHMVKHNYVDSADEDNIKMMPKIDFALFVNEKSNGFDFTNKEMKYDDDYNINKFEGT